MAVLGAASLETLHHIGTDPEGEFTVAAAGIALLLSRYFSRTSIVFRTPALLADSDQEFAEIPLIIHVASHLSVREYLGSVARTVESTYSDPDCPIDTLGERLTNVSLVDPRVHGPLRDYDRDDVRFTLRLDRGEIEIAYNADRVEAFLVEGFAAHLAEIFSRFAAIDSKLEQIEILSSLDRRRLTLEFNQTDAPHPSATVVQMFEAQVERTPEAAALVYRGQTTTYQELNRRANQLARHLSRRYHIGPESSVGIMMDRSDTLLVVLLAVLKAGGAFVPIDAENPLSRIKYLLADTGLGLLLTESNYAQLPLDFAGEILVVDRELPVLSEESANLEDGAGLANLAYIIYTSGTTGNPKGCLLEHRSLANYVSWANAFYFEDESCGNFCLLTSISVDFTLSAIFCTLLRGKALHIYPQAEDTQAILAHALQPESGIDFLKLTPSHIRLLEPLDCHWTGVRKIIVGGEDLTPRQIRIVRGINPNIRIYNEYGPTEATVGCVVKEIDDSNHPVLIGRPIANTRIYILDEGGRLAPLGARGEICVSGLGLARGYHNRSGTTAEKFIPNPFVSGERLYRTGDVGRWLPDGNVQYFGRNDRQIKLRGSRVELGEIESMLAGHAGISGAIVVPRENGLGDKTLVAYLAGDLDLTASEVRHYLSEKLPSFMLPAEFVFLSEFPVTSGGKVDASALPPPDAAAQRAGAVYVPPRTTCEEALVRLWQEFFGSGQVGVNDTFFDLGGDSLLALRLVSRIWRGFSVEVGIEDIFELQTIASIAARIEACSPTTKQAPLIQPLSRSGELPLSLAQQRLWFIDQLEGPSSAYNISSCLRLDGRLDASCLERALSEVVRRHEVLRTTFPDSGGKPVQCIAAAEGFVLPVADLSDWAESEREREALKRAVVESERPFDLAAGPLLRALLFRLDNLKHLLLLAVHHIVFDGSSAGILIHELSQLYQAFSQGTLLRLPELSIQYADFAHWQRQQLQSENAGLQIAYWKEQLAGAPSQLDLPTDRPRPSMQTFRGGAVHFSLDKNLSEQLKSIADQAGASLYMLLLASFAAFLARYTGQTDIVIGSPVANRTLAEIEPLIGFFVNTLPLRISVDSNPTYRDLLGRVRRLVLDAFAHQDVAFEKLVDSLAPERNLSHNPIFQVMFAYENASRQALTLPGLTITPLDGGESASKFDLTLHMTETASELAATLEYNIDLFDRDTILRMAGHLQTLLRGAADNPGLTLAELPFLTTAEQTELLHWDDNEVISNDLCIHQIIEQQVGRTPDRIAITLDHEQLSYRELNARANQLARYLQQLGAGPEVLIGICLDRSIDMIVGLLAILKAGAAYLPLDPDYPADRLGFMLEDGGVRILVSQQRLLPQLPSTNACIALLDEAWAKIAGYSPVNLTSTVTPSNLAYVIYTSGSTGSPKGMGIEHRNVAQLLLNAGLRFVLSENDVWMQSHSYCFDFSVWEIFGALSHGARLLVPRWEEVRDPATFVRMVRDAGVTVLNQTPSAFYGFIEEALRQEKDWNTDLRYVIFGGDRLEPARLQRWAERFPSVALINMYGITETTVHVTFHVLTTGDLANRGQSPIGRPLPGITTYVCDASLNLLPVGVAGELYVGGGGVGRGYVNRPQLTAGRFIASPFQPGGRLYKTGDQVRYRSGGSLEFLGRLDQQVKIRGFRVELGEIEMALLTHVDIREAVVVAREEEAGGRRLIAYIVAERGQVLSPGELRAFLKISLPDYMLPAVFVTLPALPLTSNGKIDRKVLPEPGLTQTAQAASAPHDDLEEVLAGIWATVLHCRTPGVNDNFFELGGHSLLATQLTSHLHDALGIALPVRWLFEAPTVAELAARIRASGPQGEWAAPVPENPILHGAIRITPDLLPLIILSQGEIDQVASTVNGGVSNIKDVYPLAPLQEGILFHYLLQNSGDAYLNHLLLAFDSSARKEAFLAALQWALDRHDILRTALVWEHLPEPVQVVWRQATLPVETRSFDPAAGPIAEQLLASCQPRHTRLDLSQAPLLRIIAAQDGERWLLLCLSHHLIMDHTTVEVLLEEIAANLRGESELLAPPLPFRNFVAQARAGIGREAHELFFRGMLGGIETPTAPFGLLDVQGDGSEILERRRDLPSELAQRLRRQASLLSASPAALCHLAWALLLSRCCGGQEQVVFGSVLFGRMQGTPGVQRAVGMFINTLPVCIPCDGRPAAEALRDTQRRLLALLLHEEASLSLAVGCSAVRQPTPLFSALLNYRHSPKVEDTSSQLEGVEFLRFEERTNYPLTLSVDDLGEGFGVTAQVSQSIDPDRICAFMEQALESLVTALEDAPETPLCSLDVLPPAEKLQLLIEWNATDVGWQSQVCVHQLFEAQVAQNPHAIAVVCEDETLGYLELNKRANRLAHALIALGVAPDALVAIALERSPSMIVAILAVLKAGGAYLPLDPDYPAERLAFMLEDSGARILLTGASLHEGLPPSAGHTMCFDVDSPDIARQPDVNPNRAAAPDSLIYVIYTSGSTGKPKGAMNTHGAISNRLLWMQQTFQLDASDCVLQKTSSSFDVSVWEFFWPLITGARLVFARPGGHRDSVYLSSLIGREGITTMHFVPPMLQAFLETVAPGQCSSLRRVLCSGQELPVSTLTHFFEVFPGCELHNLYGPTEAAIDVTWYPCAPETARLNSVPIGRPIANTQLYVLDRHQQPAPIGVPGELYIGGAGLGRGYLHRPELTAGKFVQNPFSREPHSRLYRTGDLVRYRHDGNIEFLGRLDHQVKIRGFRIEPGEIEAALTAYPGVREAMVVASGEPSGDQRLIAYVVPALAPPGTAGETLNPPALPSVPELRAFLKLTVPDYMLPSTFVFLPSLPSTPSGKIDRRALPQLETPGQASAGRHVKPRNLNEEKLAGIWQDILSCRTIGVTDDYFQLGGHSLLAVRLMARVEKEFGIRLPLAHLFAHPTIEQMALALTSQTTSAGWEELVEIRPGAAGHPLFLLPGAGGNVIYYHRLAALLKGANPIYGLQAIGLDGSAAPLTSVEEIAARNVAAIRSVAKGDGPIYLAGHSFGGQVAFEMSRQLRRQNIEIGLLAILDTPAPLFRHNVLEDGWDDARWLAAIAVVIGAFLGADLEISHQQLASLDAEAQLNLVLDRIAAKGSWLGGADRVHLRAYLNVYKANSQIDYRPPPETQRLPIALFKASSAQPDEIAPSEDLLQLKQEPAWGWDRFSSLPVEVNMLPGDHLSILLEPHVHVLAEKLNALLPA